MKNQLWFPYYFERRTNVPQQRMEVLSNTLLIEALAQLNDQTAALKGASAQCCEILEQQFALSKNNKLLNYKRKVFNLNPVNTAQLLDLDTTSRDGIAAYALQYEAYVQAKEALNMGFEKAYLDNRGSLWDFYKGDGIVTKAMPLISADFHYSLSKYLEIPHADHKTKQRKLDHQLLRLMTRATKKTSPFSTLTTVGLGRFSRGEADNSGTSQMTLSATLNHFHYRKVFDAILSLPFVKAQLAYRLTNYQSYPDHYYFLTQRDPNKGKVYKSIDHNMSLKRNNLITGILEWMGDGTHEYDSILDFLTTLMPKERASQFLGDTLIKAGILTPTLTLSEFSTCIHTAFCEKLGTLEDDEDGLIGKIIAAFNGVKGLIEEFSTLEGSARYGQLAKIKGQMEGVNSLLGEAINLDMLVYEDTYFQRRADQLPQHHLSDESLQALGQLQKFTAILDQSYPIFSLFSKAFYEKFGDQAVQADSLEVYHLYSQTGSKHVALWKDGLTTLEPSGQSTVDQLMALKGSFIEAIAHAKALGKDTHDISETIDEIVAAIPSGVGASNSNHSTTYFYQTTEGGLVINKIYSGFQSFFSRFYKDYQWIYDQEDYNHYCQEIFDNHNKVEVLEAFGFNANVHRPFSQKRLMLPFSESVETLSRDEILLNQCYFKYDHETAMVKLYDPDHLEISPFFAGSLVYVLMPTLLKALLGMNRNTRFDVSQLSVLSHLNEGAEGVEGAPGAHGGLVVDFLPRVQYGPVTLMRRQWLVRQPILPPNTTDVERFQLLHRVFSEAGIPTHFYMRRYTGDKTIDYVNMGRTELKPQYIDITSPLLFKELLGDWEPGTLIVIEEPYPDDAQETYIREFQIELTTKSAS